MLITARLHCRERTKTGILHLVSKTPNAMDEPERLTEISEDQVDPAVLAHVSPEFCRSNSLFLLREENGELVGAIAGSEGLLPLKEVASSLKMSCRPVFASRGAIMGAINRYYSETGDSGAKSLVDEMKTEDLDSLATEWEKPKDLMELTDEGPVIKLLNSVLFEAVRERASDIHVEPYEKSLEIRFRVDGVLRKVLTPPKVVQESLMSRIKIMSALNIAEKRLAQDGRIRLLVGGRDIDLRVSIIPTSFGERAVLRLLDRRQGMMGFDQIGMKAEDIGRMEKLLSRPNGIILVTGPTGSGKSTTLYAGLNRLNSDERNIITIEDPVEYQVAGIGQIQVNPRIGLTFAQGLRSILRQDPDVIMVGEIRDSETAEIAVHASLTGHLVLSTLHTNSASGAIARLLDMGIEPFLVSSSLSAVLGQRLVRRICPHCRGEVPVPPELKTYFGSNPLPENLYRGSGCSHCGESGYFGRTGIFEFLMVTSDVRRLVLVNADARDIEEKAVSQGMTTMFADGLSKAVKGETTLEEILRVTQADDAGISL